MRKPRTKAPVKISDQAVKSSAAWWQGVIDDQRFSIVLEIAKGRCKHGGVQESAHAQAFVGGYREGYLDFPNALIEITAEDFSESQNDGYAD